MSQDIQEQRLYINSVLQKQPNDSDTNFTLNLGSLFNCKRMVLNQCLYDNYLTNFYGKYSDLSIQTEDDYIRIICDQYITKDQLVPYLNSFTEQYGLTLTDLSSDLQPWDYRLKIGGNILFAFSGIGYQKLGVESNNFSVEHTATSSYDFAQSGVINVRFNNLPNAITNTLTSTFVINNNTTFGTRISHYQYSQINNQQIVFSNPQQFSQLSITLLDCDGQQLQTVNGNNNGAEFLAVISCFNE